jgi:hypothetical protein
MSKVIMNIAFALAFLVEKEVERRVMAIVKYLEGLQISK